MTTTLHHLINQSAQCEVLDFRASEAKCHLAGTVYDHTVRRESATGVAFIGMAKPGLSWSLGLQDTVNADMKDDLCVTVSGRADPSTTVTLTWGQVKKSVVTSDHGYWWTTFDFDEISSDGASTSGAIAADAAGSAASGSCTAIAGTASPAQPVLAPAADAVRSTASEQTASPILIGSAKPGTFVSIEFGNNWYTGVYADSAGRWFWSLGPE